MALYALEAAGLVLALAVHKYLPRLHLLTLRQWTWILAPLAAVVASGIYVGRCYRRSRDSGSRQFTFSLATNLFALTLLLVAGEAMVRVFSVPTHVGPSFATTLLLPRSWEQLRASNAEVLKNAPGDDALFVSDSLLGWTVGPNRRSADGLYLSSAEGIRSPRSGMAYANHPAPFRIATVGDSYTFGLEVPFEETWGFQLERALGPQSVVLNFGVDGYGVDQALLRYLRDVRPWRPAMTILSFIDHDLYRSLAVYGFVSFPEWRIPFAKPRFVLRDGTLGLLNAPLISSLDILATRSVRELPFIEYDPGYHASEWQWHPYHASHLLRFLLSRYRSWPASEPVADTAVEQLNSELMLMFARRATAEGTVPLVVYLPSRVDFERRDRSAKDQVLTVLQKSGVRYLDLTSCLREIGPDKALIAGGPHYTPEGNAAVAGCLLPAVRGQFPQLGINSPS